MANQAIALQARAPQNDFMGRAIQQNAQMMNMMSQQRAAERQAAQATQAMGIARAEEGRKAALHGPAMRKADYEAFSAEQKAAMEFMEFAYAGIDKSRGPEDVLKIAGFLKQKFPSEIFAQVIDQTLADMPSDPAQFAEWQAQTKFETLKNTEQLAQEFTTQNLGTSTRVIATPKYGRGEARVVPGSDAPVTLKPTVVNVEGLGPIIVDPNTGQGFPAAAGPTGGYTPPQGAPAGGPAPSAPAGGGSPVARALQTNPGALKDGPYARSQPGYTGASGGFATFKTPEDGIRAQEKLLRNSYIGKGFDTIDEIVNKYAPVSKENSAASVANYKKYIAQRTGLDINAPIAPSQVPAVAAAMREFETGQRPGTAPADRGSAGGAEKPPSTVAQAASAAEKQRKAKTFRELAGVDLATQAYNDTDRVSQLIKGSTSGVVETIGAEIVGAIPESIGGGATQGMKNIGQLETIAASLTLAFAPDGRLSTGVSNEDRGAIERQLGVIQNPTIPSGKRLAAWREVKRIMARSVGLTEPPKKAPAGGKKKPPIESFGRRR
jgi:hypothetical protein